MNIKLLHSKLNVNSKIIITGSKSETNRLLLLQALFPEISLKNTSNSDDSEVMIKALSQTSTLKTDNGQPATVDVHHAGTAMRFLTAYFAVQPNCEVVLTGSSRMKERPIHVLVGALNSLGGAISYEEKVGFPPIRIKGKELSRNEILIQASTSSQFISALLLIAPKLKKGLKLQLEGEITSLPYVQMTLALLNEIGVETSFTENTITVNFKEEIPNSKFQIAQPTIVNVESDWSSASYFYSMVALSAIGTQITLSSYKKNSLQGDAILSEIYKDFGVETDFNDNGTMTISKVIINGNYNINEKINGNDNINDNRNANKNAQTRIQNRQPRTENREPTTHNRHLQYNLNNSPDIAQTIAVTCFGLGFSCELTGLHTLKIKETDRLEALKTELSKLGAEIAVAQDSLRLKASGSDFFIEKEGTVATYQDHRMAMAFAPLALKTAIVIKDAEVVSKSYPDFWDDLEKCGISLEIVGQ
jgi:3-phosphoshikimate 1-carboxyvinyltransferase